MTFQKWREANGETFTGLDYVFQMLRESEFDQDAVIAIARLVWPPFVEVDGFVFLSDQYTEEKLRDLRAAGTQEHRIEYWMNLVTVDEIFDQPEQAVEFTMIVAAAWNAKLSYEFSGRSFRVETPFDSETGEVGVVFFSV